MQNKTSKITKTTGTLSIEHLHHFRCGECNKWWSVGDPSIALPGKSSAMKRKWFCPWCGKVNILKPGKEVKHEF
jgi:hypothetical protein